MKYTVSAVATAAVIGLAGVAHAGGSLKDEPIYESPTVWSGFYVGAHVAGASGSSDLSKAEEGGPKFALETDPSGAFGGMQLGFDRQFGDIVLGIVGDVSVAGIDGQDQQDGPPAAFNTEYDWIATVRARLGVAASQDLLAYVHGGIAIADISFDSLIADGPWKSVYDDDVSTGWVAGAGVEWVVNPVMSVFAEYSYMDFGEQTETTGLGPKFVEQESDLHAIKGGINFRLGQR